MKYKELIDMGFERNDIFADDKAFFNQHGYECFWLEKTLLKESKIHILIEWIPWEDKLELITYKKENVLTRREITEEEMEVLVRVTKRTGDIPKAPNYTHYC